MCITLFKSLNKEADRIEEFNAFNLNVETAEQDLPKAS